MVSRLLCNLLRPLLWNHREFPLLPISYSTMTRSRIILVHIRCRLIMGIQLLHIRGERPSSNRARLWRLNPAPVHHHPTLLPHPYPSRVAGRLLIPLGYLLQPHLSVAGNFAPHIRGQHSLRVRHFRRCTPLLNQTSFIQSKYVIFFSSLSSRCIIRVLGTKRHARRTPSSRTLGRHRWRGNCS